MKKIIALFVVLVLSLVVMGDRSDAYRTLRNGRAAIGYRGYQGVNPLLAPNYYVVPQGYSCYRGYGGGVDIYQDYGVYNPYGGRVGTITDNYDNYASPYRGYGYSGYGIYSRSYSRY